MGIGSLINEKKFPSINVYSSDLALFNDLDAKTFNQSVINTFKSLTNLSH